MANDWAAIELMQEIATLRTRLQESEDSERLALRNNEGLRARVASLEDMLAQADRWILMQKIDGNRDGACLDCYPNNDDIPPAFAGFKCGWHWAKERAALAPRSERREGEPPCPPHDYEDDGICIKCGGAVEANYRERKEGER